MASTHNRGGTYWGYLIAQDKSAAPLLEHLCLGLAKIIGQLEPPNAGPKNKLTPQRLAAFYRSVGGNYDTLFNTPERGLSFMYTTLGCWHTLQPTPNPHEPPSIPALTTRGFVKWQTIQILLSPTEQAPFLQEAVKVYDVPRPDGGFFPKQIPRDAFPDKPDEGMERWHRHVTGRLNQENEVRRLKNSPYQSPYNPIDRNDGYFSPNGKFPLPQIRRPSRPSRAGSQDQQDLARRRSSVPDLPSPQPPGSDTLQWGTDQYGRPIDPKKRNSRSQSAHRISNSSSQNRPSTGSSQHRTSNPSNRLSQPSQNYRPTSGYFGEANGLPPNSYHHHRQKSGDNRQRSPSTIDESSGSEASSETSFVDQGNGRRKSREDRRNSLWPPNSLLHKRRHSHDATYEPERKPALPPRPNANSHHTRQRSGTQISTTRHDFQPQQSPLSARPVGPNAVHFRDHIFENDRDENVNSAPEFTPSYPHKARASVSQSRPADPPPMNPRQIMDSMAPLSRENSIGSGTDMDRGTKRLSEVPMRIQTVSGVGGRRYPDIRNTADRRSVAPMPM